MPDYSAADTLLRNDFTQASKFANRATYGGNPDVVARIQEIGPLAWMDEQKLLSVPNYFDTQTANGDLGYSYLIWDHAFEHPAQLQQRMAFALSWILAMASSNVKQFRAADYVDRMHADALTNFRTLIERISLSQAMAEFLSYDGNLPADPAKAQYPDENYAREIMQLFTIGLWELNQDGTRVRVNGEDVPTYDQDDILGMARVFTGWKGTGFVTNQNEDLTLTEANHEDGEKTFLGVTIPAGTGGYESLTIALDTLFQHPSCAPFICHKLVQRYVTSNPTPAYIARVTAVWADNGAGVEGDLFEVLKAILLDSEALQTSPPDTFGKYREPVMIFTAIGRALHLTSTAERFAIGATNSPNLLAQSPFRPPNVFSYSDHYFIPVGTPIGEAGLYSPEADFQGADTALARVEWLQKTFYRPPNGLTYGPGFDALKALASTPAALVDELERRICPGALSAATKQTIVNSLVTTGDGSSDTSQYNRVTAAAVQIGVATDGIYER